MYNVFLKVVRKTSEMIYLKYFSNTQNNDLTLWKNKFHSIILRKKNKLISYSRPKKFEVRILIFLNIQFDGVHIMFVQFSLISLNA